VAEAQPLESADLDTALDELDSALRRLDELTAKDRNFPSDLAAIELKHKTLTDQELDSVEAIQARSAEMSKIAAYGPVWGRQDIAYWYVEMTKDVQSSNNLFTVDEDSPHTLCTAGNELWATGKWSQTLKGQNGSIEVKGYWSAIDVLEGNDWKFRMLC
jgi:hypothetical protein